MSAISDQAKEGDYTLFNDLLVHSYEGDYTKIVDVIISFLKKNTNAEVVRQQVSEKKWNVIATFGTPTCVINCHMDTVPPKGEWKTNPHELTVKEEKLYGLGTCDTKGNIFAVLCAVCSVKPKNLMLVFSVDEEIPPMDVGVMQFLKSSYCEGITHAVVCEPTCGDVVCSHPGYYSYSLTFETEPSHSSQKGENAIIYAMHVGSALSKKGFNVGSIEGGGFANVVAHSCTMLVSARTMKSHAEMSLTVQDIVEHHCSDKVDVNVTPLSVGVPFSNSSPWIKDDKGDEQSVGFWSEAALFSQKGINTVLFGAGDVAQAHNANEFVSIGQLKKAQGMFEKIIVQLNTGEL